MTSRIQADGEGKEAKWADIDDDEDDWAPETIEWNDGTKITLAHNESLPIAGQDIRPSSVSTDTQGDEEPRKFAVPKPTTSVGPNATILKLGANAERQQAKAGSLLMKGSSEKSLASAKGAVLVPAKSPWAPLPPVEKVSPIAINPAPQLPQGSRYYQRDQHGYESMPISMPSPAKEIAADDFNRSWRENQTGLPRELYNSNSGRYEPVREGRRGSTRNDGNFRPPSLLQRPTHSEQSVPAEPSAAFQTHRTSANQGGDSWNRRRTSSNVSGGSGTYGRRMSLGKPPDLPAIPNDMLQQRRGSQPNGPERATSPRTMAHSQSAHPKSQYPPRGASPGQSPSSATWQTRASPSMSYAPPGSQMSPGAHPQQPLPQAADAFQQPQGDLEDPVAMQQRIMREKRELAMKRRKEEEEREEAAKKERIRLKLEALGTPPEKPKAQDDGPVPPPAFKESVASAQSPPKPPVPEATGEPKQYGMMKVHHPETVKKLVAASERIPERTVDHANRPRRSSSPTQKPETFADSGPSTINGVRQTGEPHHVRPSEIQQEALLVDRNAQPWKNALSGADAYSSWAGSRLANGTATGGNLWGPPSNDKALGNGTFDRNLTGFSTRDVPSRSNLTHPGQPPIGPPSASERTDMSPQSFHTVPRSTAEGVQSIPSYPSPEKRSTGVDSINPIARPGPIGPPSAHSNGSRWQQDISLRRDPETAAWNNFHSVASKHEAEENERVQRELAARLEEEPRTGIRPLPPQPSFHETWRQIEVGDSAGARQVVGVSRSTGPALPLSPLHDFGAVGGLPVTEPTPRSVSNVIGGVRGSRFFPVVTEANQSQPKRAVSYSPGYVPSSPSPPPPEELESHPAFEGDVHRPLVSLPTPKAIVKLPPADLTPPPAQTSFASVTAAAPSITPSLRGGSQPIANTASWQDRFNSLFGNKTSPERKHIHAVTSATKEPLDLQSSVAPAAVSLPQGEDGRHSDLLSDAGNVVTKEVEEEEDLFEDRVDGSLPTIRLPVKAPSAAWQPALPIPQSRPRSKYFKPTQTLSIEPFVFSLFDKENMSQNGVVISIRLPGMETTKSKKVELDKKPGNPQPRQRGPSSYKSRKGVKSRESSGSYAPAQNAKNAPHMATANRNASSPRQGLTNGGGLGASPRVSSVAH